MLRCSWNSCHLRPQFYLFIHHFASLQVIFKTPVSITEHPKINEWLTLVENEMRVTLAKLLAAAVVGVAQFREGDIDAAKYLEWVDQYQVCV